FGVIFWGIAPLLFLRKVRLAGAPPGDVAVPTECVIVPPRIAPQEHAAQRHLLRLQPVAPGMDKAQELGGAEELRKAGLPESGMDKAPDRPGFVLLGAVYVAFRDIDLAVAVLGCARLSKAAARLAEDGNEWAVHEIGNDN